MLSTILSLAKSGLGSVLGVVTGGSTWLPIGLAIALVVAIGGAAFDRALWQRDVADLQTTIATMRSDELRAAEAQAVEVAQENAATAQRIAAALQREQLALAEANRMNKALNARAATLHQEINRAPPNDDGPVAPVLRGTLDRLRGPTVAPAAASPGQKGGGQNPLAR
jgi:hypothetical protein